MADVFISYSRKDKAFVQVLHQALAASKYDIWVDWQDIAPTTEWWKEIEAGIESAHTFVFVISKDSVISEYCCKEIDHAFQHGKRLIPVLRRKDYPDEALHPRLGQHQWVTFQEEEDFDAAFSALVTAIDTDLEHKKTHTRYETRAIEWVKRQQDESLLLRGNDLSEAEQWLFRSSFNKDPRPTKLQGQYIGASREYINQEQAKTARNQRRTVVTLSILLFLVTGTGVLAGILGLRAYEQQRIAEKVQTNAEFMADSLGIGSFLNGDYEQDAVLQAVRTGQKMRSTQPDSVEPDTRWRTLASIQKAIYGANEQERLIGHHDAVEAIAFSPVLNDATIATASRDKTAKLWTRRGQLLQTLRGHNEAVLDVALSGDGQTIVTASRDGTAKLWNRQGEVLQTLRAHTEAVLSVAFSPDGQTLATGSWGGQVKLWNLDGQALVTLTETPAGVSSIIYSDDGETLAIASWDATVTLLDLGSNQVQTLQGHRDAVLGVAFSPDGQTIATTSRDATVKLWNRQGQELQTIKGLFLDIAFSPDGDTIATAGWDKLVRLWIRDAQGLHTLPDHQEPVVDVAFSPNGQTIATASRDNTVRLWQRDGTTQQILTGHNDYVLAVAFSPDGETIATVSADQTLKLWNLEGQELFTLNGHDAAVEGVAFNPVRGASSAGNGIAFATASRDNTAKLWNLNGKALQTLTGHTDYVLDVAFSPRGDLVATAGKDKTARLWTLDGRLFRTLRGHDNYVSSVAFSPDGKTLATSSGDATIKLWNLEGQLQRTLKGHYDNVFDVTFSPNGEVIGTASRDGTIKLWNRDGQELQTLNGHRKAVFSLAFSPDQTTLATASLDETVKLWNFELDDAINKGCQWLGTYFTQQSPELLMELEVCQQQNPALLPEAAGQLVARGDELARNGMLDQAIQLYEQAIVWDGSLAIDPQARAQRICNCPEKQQP